MCVPFKQSNWAAEKNMAVYLVLERGTFWTEWRIPPSQKTPRILCTNKLLTQVGLRPVCPQQRGIRDQGQDAQKQLGFRDDEKKDIFPDIRQDHL